MRWVEISSNPSKKRFDFLQSYLAKKGIENTVNYIKATPTDFPEALKKALTEYDNIRIGTPFGQSVLGQFKRQTAFIVQLGVSDCLFKTDDEWWGRSYLYDSFNEILREIGTKLDISGPVLIVGSGAACRACVSSLIKIGASEFSIASSFVEEGQELIEKLSRTYFNINFKFVGQDQLVLLPGSHGLAINTTPYIPSNEIIDELSYFNFLKRDGFFCDFSLDPVESSLIIEAKEIGIEVLNGSRIAAYTDTLWTREVFGIEIDSKDYEKQLVLSFGESNTSDESN